ncbi:serine O-acetyltransferase [Neobacillus mesonae]|uniref:serine O-acetyltransferase n=1 Tax=Neobacillus mesonae TaxID=1193713 RepID=UPI0008296FD0|nr:serine O-acetyltransferase [Neobacillus mesonae]
MAVNKIHKISRILYEKKLPLMPKFLTYFIRIVYGCYIPPTVQIGEGTSIGYDGVGVVIHYKTVIGKNCVIGPGVTIGGTSGKEGAPILGDNVALGTGCKILGPVKVGDNVVIGANSVVTKDVPDNCMVVGIPGKIVRTDIDIKKYNKIASI